MTGQKKDGRIVVLRKAIEAKEASRGIVTRDIAEARKDRSHSAVMMGHLRRESIDAELLRLRLDLSSLEAASTQTRQRTPAEQEAWERQHADEVEEIHLQIYVVAYLARHRGVFLATADGPLEILAG
jgi:hypothetical protein